jgi:SAM-dependent methyltransferase
MDVTLNYYENECGTFISETIEADTKDLRNRFLKNVPDGGTILDLGCGSGRDTKAFLDAGCWVSAIDGSAEICREASVFTGIDVRCLDFFDIPDNESYDGIWACASVLHVEKSRIPDLIRKLYKNLNRNGVIYLSFKYGEHNGIRDGRHFTDLNETEFRKLMEEVYCEDIGRDDFQIIDEWQSEDVRRGKNVQWLNEILKKSDTV